MTDCKHKSGDFIVGMWICASCFRKLDRRPKRYDMVRNQGYSGDGGCRAGGYRQQVVWQADIAKHDGMTFGEFVECMALRFVARTRGHMDKSDALSYAIDVLRSLKEPFGSDDIDWSKDGAWELADEEMTYWDSDDTAANS